MGDRYARSGTKSGRRRPKGEVAMTYLKLGKDVTVITGKWVYSCKYRELRERILKQHKRLEVQCTALSWKRKARYFSEAGFKEDYSIWSPDPECDPIAPYKGVWARD
jgi:hypothetical protein